jgi:hypothetical protein
MIENDINDARSMVAITHVDLTNMVFRGEAVIDRPKQLNMTILPGSTWVVPSVGEQWLIQRNGMEWHLLSKVNFQDPRALLPQTEGMYAYGGRGPTHIVGESIHLHAPVFMESQELRPAEQQEVELPVTGFMLTGGEPTIVALSSTEAGSGMVGVTVSGRGVGGANAYALDITLAQDIKTIFVPQNLDAYFSETFFLPAESITGISFATRPGLSAGISGLAVRITSL